MFSYLTLVLIVLAESGINLNLLPANICNPGLLGCNETMIVTQRDDIVQRVVLIAREENYPPPGTLPNPDRDIGFATVLISLENPYLQEIKLIISRIEIRNVADDTLQKFSSSLQEVYLKPLENSEISFDLTNKTGYAGQDRVKAVVTYQTGEQVNLIESEPVEVERY